MHGLARRDIRNQLVAFLFVTPELEPDGGVLQSLFACPAGDAVERVIHINEFAVMGAGDGDGVGCGSERFGELLLAGSQGFGSLVLLGHIPEHQDNPRGLACIIHHGCRAVCDLPLRAVPCDEYCVVGQADDLPRLQNTVHRVFNRLPRMGVHDVENRGQLLPGGASQGPSSELFSHCVHVDHGSLAVRDDNPIANGAEGGSVKLFTFTEVIEESLLLGYVPQHTVHPQGPAVAVPHHFAHAVNDDSFSVLLVQQTVFQVVLVLAIQSPFKGLHHTGEFFGWQQRAEGLPVNRGAVQPHHALEIGRDGRGSCAQLQLPCTGGTQGFCLAEQVGALVVGLLCSLAITDIQHHTLEMGDSPLLVPQNGGPVVQPANLTFCVDDPVRTMHKGVFFALPFRTLHFMQHAAQIIGVHHLGVRDPAQ